MRLERESAIVREAYPDAYVDLAVFVTEFGGATGLILVLALAYWLTRRQESALVASYAVCGIGVVLLLKSLLAMPRPPEELFLIAHGDDPYGFPSGHAFMAVVVYGGFLVTFDRLRDPLAVASVTALVVAISLSRIVLGVHYLGDVVVGALLGVGFLVGFHRLVGGRPARGFAIGGIVAVPAIAASNAEPYTLVALGAAIGGALASLRLEAAPPLRSRLEGGVLSVVGLGYLVTIGTAESTLAAATPVGIVVANALLVAGVLLAPLALDRLGSGWIVDSSASR